MWRLKLLRQRKYTGTMKRYMMYCKNDCCYVVQLELSMVSVRHVFEATAYTLRAAEGSFISCLPVCWLEVPLNPNGSAIGHLDTIFLVFLCLRANDEMISNFQVSPACFLCRPRVLNSANSRPLPYSAPNYFFQIIHCSMNR